MLAVRFRAIDGKGLSPFWIRDVVGRIHRVVVLTSLPRSSGLCFFSHDNSKVVSPYVWVHHGPEPLVKLCQKKQELKNLLRRGVAELILKIT